MKINDYRHSASKGNDWYENPSLWIFRNLLGKRSETSPRMAMGNSAEFGCALDLFFDRSDADVVEHCTNHMVNQFDGEWFDETDKVGGIALNLAKAIKEEFPDVAKLLLEKRYVDDIMKSQKSKVDADNIIKKTEKVLQKIDFFLDSKMKNGSKFMLKFKFSKIQNHSTLKPSTKKSKSHIKNKMYINL